VRLQSELGAQVYQQRQQGAADPGQGAQIDALCSQLSSVEEELRSSEAMLEELRAELEEQRQARRHPAPPHAPLEVQ
jgi:hypothetical protein